MCTSTHSLSQGMSRNIKDISPTFISTDLLTPDQQERITIPAKGYQVVDSQPLGNKTWGENVTAYGGIGVLPFLGQAKARDLDVSRNHLHFGSGFSKYENKVQPYRLTPLTLSTCRINDQVLPPCFKEYLDPKVYVIPADIPKESYFSHTCRKEVFPAIDPDRTKGGVPVLTDNSRAALHDYYKDLYHTPWYHKVYPDQTEVIKRNVKKHLELPQKTQEHLPGRKIDQPTLQTFVDRIGKFLKESPGPVSLCSRLMHLLQSSSCKEIYFALLQLLDNIKDTKSILIQDEIPLANAVLSIIDRCKAYATESDENDEPTKRLIHEYLVSYHQEKSQLVSYSLPPDKVLKQQPSSGRERLEGVGLRWPPGTSQVVDRQKMQLKEVETLIPIQKHRKTQRPKANQLEVTFRCSDTDISRPKSALKTEVVSKVIPGFPAYKRFIDNVLPTPIDYGETEKRPSQTEQVEYTSLANQAQPPLKSTLNPWQWTEKSEAPREVRLPTLPLADSLHPTGNRIQDRLGLRFKAAAHKRYHEMFTDSVPDLRDTQVTRKRYFFYGHHASDFRG